MREFIKHLVVPIFATLVTTWVFTALHTDSFIHIFPWALSGALLTEVYRIVSKKNGRKQN